MSTKVKFILTYFGGFVTGVIFIFALGMIINASQGKDSVKRDVDCLRILSRRLGQMRLKCFRCCLMAVLWLRFNILMEEIMTM